MVTPRQAATVCWSVAGPQPELDPVKLSFSLLRRREEGMSRERKKKNQKKEKQNQMKKRRTVFTGVGSVPRKVSLVPSALYLFLTEGYERSPEERSQALPQCPLARPRGVIKMNRTICCPAITTSESSK
ncbi:hypothetical protein EYF80_004421 [Liparis tanakae]|uniref:Uncharacterized protein n=1 Tax=Liparis tanakae TaxID=230148 RepID=A0A4Z2J5B7_9TELE|nr:hypothetical protein EYF80_004421 [Liparis tanakae]